jgi:hypothetical protein
MNRRIKKKIKTRLQSSFMQQLDINKRKFYPISKTYREIKNEHKRFHETMIHYRHIEYRLKGYSYQLRTSRRLRKGWKTRILTR